VLFLDEFTEFRRDAIQGLRQPLEDGRGVVTRMVGLLVFPARFTLVAAANLRPEVAILQRLLSIGSSQERLEFLS
jgi:magnesium chelatase family protein